MTGLLPQWTNSEQLAWWFPDQTRWSSDLSLVIIIVSTVSHSLKQQARYIIQSANITLSYWDSPNTWHAVTTSKWPLLLLIFFYWMETPEINPFMFTSPFITPISCLISEDPYNQLILSIKILKRISQKSQEPNNGVWVLISISIVLHM